MKSETAPPQRMSHPFSDLTDLSRPKGRDRRPKGRDRRHFKHLSRMACASLLVTFIAALGGPSCLITTSPDFTKPTRTPPFLTDLNPAPYQIRIIKTTPGVPRTDTIAFKVVSEDLQSDIAWMVLLDFEGFDVPYPRLTLNSGNIPAGHIDEPNTQERAVTAPITFGNEVTAGCHSVTLAVSHGFTYPMPTVFRPAVKGDVALATWWYDIDDDPSQPGLLSKCVTKSAATGDGGVDGSDARSE
jgi:hypothetical protein